MDAITHRRVHARNVALHVAECGDGPLVVLVHGMADLWYTWRNQLAALVAAGVPYRPRAESPPTAIMDNTLRFFEESLASVARSDDGHGALREAFCRFLYALSGDAPRGLVETLFVGGRGPDARVLRAVTPPSTLPRWLSRQDLDYYVQEYARTGFEGVLNRYRNLVRDWEDSADVAEAVITPPALFVAGERDPAVVFGSPEPMKALVPALRGISIVAGCGHWVQQERAAEVNEALVEFVRQAWRR